MTRRLSRRQAQVERELFTADGIKTIAHRMGLTVGTIKVYTIGIYRKRGVSGRVELMSCRIAELENRGRLISAG